MRINSDRRRRSILQASLLVVAITAATSALAHDTWLLPARYRLAPGDTIVLDLTSAMHFPEPESGPDPSRVAAWLRVGGSTGTLQAVTAAPGAASKALRLSTAVARPGVAAAWCESRPREIELKPEEVEHYLAEAGAADVLAQWVKGGKLPWRETYVKFAKTFVRVGRPAGDRSWAEPVGMAFEMVPEVDPTGIRAGARFSLRLVEGGQPAAGLTVGAVAAGVEQPLVAVTDAEGRASFTLSRRGPWLIRAIHIRPGEMPGTWRSRFTTLTVSVGEP